MRRYDGKAVIKKLSPQAGKRMLVISDIHGNLPYFEGILGKVGYCCDDILIIDGDFLEKGLNSLGTLRRVMELTASGNTHVICGNCDGWHAVFDMTPEEDDRVLEYINYRGKGLLWDMFLENGIDPLRLEHYTCLKELLKDRYAA